MRMDASAIARDRELERISLSSNEVTRQWKIAVEELFRNQKNLRSCKV